MKRGQASMEYMLILGFMFLLLIPLLVVYATTQKQSTDQLTEGQVLKVGNTIRDAAERIYFAGDPAQETISLYFPERIQQINITNKSIVFVMSGGAGSYDLVVTGLAPLNGTLKTNTGIHIVRLVSQNNVVQVSD
jgi:uncharacterized protein (UPF0333 family)